MWNFETELSVRDCVRGVVVSNRAGVCHLLLETGESAVAFFGGISEQTEVLCTCLLYTSPSPRDAHESRMPSSA